MADPSYDAAQNRNFLNLKAFSFSFYMTMALIISQLPLYFESQGYSKLEIGTLYSIGPLAGIFANLFWGVISDRYNTIKKILMICLAGQFFMVIGMIYHSSFAMLTVIMLFFYFFQTPMNPLNDSQILLTIRNTKKSYASFRMWGSVGFASSSLIFGWLLGLTGAEWTVYLMFATIVVSLILGAPLKERQGTMSKMDFSGIIPVLTSRKFLIFLGLVFVLMLGHRVNDGFLGLYMQERGASNFIVGLAWTFASMSEIPVFFLLSKYGHRFKELPLLGIVGILYCIRFLLTFTVSSPVGIAAVQLMHGVTFGMFLFTALRYLQQIVPDQYKSTGMAVFTVTWVGVAGLISGTVGGWVYDAIDAHTLYVAAIILSAIASVGFFAAHLSRRNAA
ncbi:MFS transporter [Xylanibacillus composti]|nr:MFS transporter [Xylanibacillus composti]